MKSHSPFRLASLLGIVMICIASAVIAGQAPGSSTEPEVAITHRDRVYAAEQFSNTVSVTDPADNKLLGVIRLGEPQPANFSPLYRGQVLVHGMGFSPDHHTLAVVSIGSNSVTFIDTRSNSIKHVTYVGRSPHEAFYTRDGAEVWVTVRGENYVAVLDGQTFMEKSRIITAAGPGMTIFSPDGQYAYICSSFTPEIDIATVREHRIIARVAQPSPFCPNIAATPDGKQVWATLKDIGKTIVFDARPPFAVLKTLDTGPITNHVNFIRNSRGQLAYVTVGGLNRVEVFRTDDFTRVQSIAVGAMPHGVWPSGDGTRVYVGLENGDALTVIDTQNNSVIGTVPIGQAPQALVYVSDAVPEGDGLANLQPLGLAGNVFHLSLSPPKARGAAPTSVSLFDQGLVQVLEAAVTGLHSGENYVLALSAQSDGKGSQQPLATFRTNAAGSAVVNSIGPIRQLVRGTDSTVTRYLVILPGTPEAMGEPAQIQTDVKIHGDKQTP